MDLSEKTKVKLPVVALISAGITLVSVGVTYGIQKSEADSQRAELVRVERDAKERDAAASRLIDDMQRVTVRIMSTLERLDERSVVTQRDIEDIKRRSK